MSKSQIVAAFALVTETETKLFATEAEALEAQVLIENAASIEAKVAVYLEARGLESKNAKAKANLLSDFLVFEASLEASEQPVATEEVIALEEEELEL